MLAVLLYSIADQFNPITTKTGLNFALGVFPVCAGAWIVAGVVGAGQCFADFANFGQSIRDGPIAKCSGFARCAHRLSVADGHAYFRRKIPFAGNAHSKQRGREAKLFGERLTGEDQLFFRTESESGSSEGGRECERGGLF